MLKRRICPSNRFANARTSESGSSTFFSISSRFDFVTGRIWPTTIVAQYRCHRSGLESNGSRYGSASVPYRAIACAELEQIREYLLFFARQFNAVRPQRRATLRRPGTQFGICVVQTSNQVRNRVGTLAAQSPGMNKIAVMHIPSTRGAPNPFNRHTAGIATVYRIARREPERRLRWARCCSARTRVCRWG